MDPVVPRFSAIRICCVGKTVLGRGGNSASAAFSTTTQFRRLPGRDWPPKLFKQAATRSGRLSDGMTTVMSLAASTEGRCSVAGLNQPLFFHKIKANFRPAYL